MQHPIATKLRVLRAPQMRAAVMTEYLINEPSSAVVETLADAIQRAVRGGDSDAILLLAVFTSALGLPDRVPYQRRRALYSTAKQYQQGAVARLFFEATPVTIDPREGPLTPERPLTPRGRPLTLGERKALARTHRRDLIPHLLRDPHPDVVTILLANPHLTESDVLVLASRRPIAAEALAQVAASHRWAPRYRVRLALVKNPYSPIPLAVRLATTLRVSDLRQVAADTHLAALVRDQAQELSTSMHP